jgi:hypothetical protein
MIDPRLAPLLAEALSLKMDVSLKLSDGEYDIFWDGIGRICATQEGVCDWLDAEIGDYCRSRGLVRTMPSFAGDWLGAMLSGSAGKSTLGLADLRPHGEPLTISMLSPKFSDEEREALVRAMDEKGIFVQIKDKYREIANLVTSPYRTAADQERLLSFQEEAERISKHTKPAGNSEEA